MAMELYAVRMRDTDRVVVAAAHTRLGARVRVSETRGVPLADLEAAVEPMGVGARRRHYRSGRAALCVMWSEREEQYHVGATYDGHERTYVTVGALSEAPYSLEGMREAARSALGFLLATGQVTPELVAWEGAPGDERVHVSESRGA